MFTQHKPVSMHGKENTHEIIYAGPDRFGSVDRVLACGLKGPRFNSSQGHVPWLQAHTQ